MRPREFRSREEPPVRPGGGDVQISSREATGSQPGEWGRARRRAISPQIRVSEAHRERAEVAAVAKMLIAGFVVLAIVLGVAYWLNYRVSA